MSALTAEEKRAFEEISYAIGDRRPHTLEDIKGVAVPRDKIQEYMNIFVEKGYYSFDGKKYALIGEGNIKFKEKRDADCRNCR